MRWSLHFLIVASLMLPFEADRWLSADLMLVDAVVADCRIVALPRPRATPAVLLDLTYAADGSTHRTQLRTLEPADDRWNWQPEERAAAERFVAAHAAGSTLRLWVPRHLPGWSAMLANGTQPPALPPRGPGYWTCVIGLSLYLVSVAVVGWKRRQRLTPRTPAPPPAGRSARRR